MKKSKTYQPQKTEKKIYRFWLKSGFFNPDNLPGKRKKTYTIALPPPNITGELHMGHALNATLQDAIIRFKRLQGYKALWVPGTDHAGIATQVRVEKELKKEGKTRFDLGREKFVKQVWQWKKKYGDIILKQFKKLGSSLDWSRTRFTMDRAYVKAVNTAFFHYYKKRWIYKKERPVNWCQRCQTSLSDLELEYKEEKGNLWYIKYPFSDKKFSDKNYIMVATTRPETMLGDTGLAVNPKDKRYKNLVGKKVILPLVGREIPIIGDRLVDLNFGTGVVKITPSHDFKDYQIAERHNLPSIKVIDEKGTITERAPFPYRGLSVFEARKKVIEDLQKKGLLQKIEGITHRVPYCNRCQTRIEILSSEQFFLKMEELAQLALDSVKKGKIKFYPKRFEKIYLDWLKNINDWCISRQIWWGHKIPLKGVDDVLDTWFSSALWPFAVLGWPQKTKDLKKFYPTDIIFTARDIINLWVARMVFSGLEFIKEIPFRVVIIHPTILTKQGRRMSKSLGTGVDPIGLVEKYGADAVRFGLAWQMRGGQDMRFTEDSIVMGKKFCNKIWNATRFVLIQKDNYLNKKQIKDLRIQKSKLTLADKKILKSLNKTIDSVNRGLENFQFGKTAENLYNFFWHDFCDVYIEKSKRQLQDAELRKQTLKIIFNVLLKSLILLHPFIPFITEEIYQMLPLKDKKKSLIVELWPKTSK